MTDNDYDPIASMFGLDAPTNKKPISTYLKRMSVSMGNETYAWVKKQKTGISASFMIERLSEGPEGIEILKKLLVY